MGYVLDLGSLQVDRMFIDAAQLTQSKAPSDASSVAMETALRLQKEFEEALKLAQDRREAEAEAALARSRAEAREKDGVIERASSSETSLDGERIQKKKIRRI